MLADSKKKISWGIFLFALFIFLALWIGLTMYTIYTSKTTEAKSSTKSSIECSTYAFEISEINYSDEKLTFRIKNTIGEDFETLVIESGNIQNKASLKSFYEGEERTVAIDSIVIEKEFSVYPEGCKEYNVKKFNI